MGYPLNAEISPHHRLYCSCARSRYRYPHASRLTSFDIYVSPAFQLVPAVPWRGNVQSCLKTYRKVFGITLPLYHLHPFRTG